MKIVCQVLILCLFLSSVLAAQTFSSKYELWREASFFRGFNVLDNSGLQLQDFIDLRKAGANFAYISTSGIAQVEPPYAAIPENRARLDELVVLCREAGLYYAIAVRQGPGRRDVYYESEGGEAPSTIWTKPAEQAMYGAMLKSIAQRYALDSLFVGLGLIVEPNPLFQQLHTSPDVLRSRLEQNGIDMWRLNRRLIDSVRTVSSDIPLLLQNVAYSSPEYFSIMEAQDDPFIVYEFHCYRPSEYVKEDVVNSRDYPGMYFSFADQTTKLHDKSYMAGTVMREVRNFHRQVGTPVIMGEFGLRQEQNNGVLYLEDMTDIALENGWHYALWDYRSKRANGNYDYEAMEPQYWQAIQSFFDKPSPISGVYSKPTANDETVRIVPNPAHGSIGLAFKWLRADTPQVVIRDMTGAVVLKRKLENHYTTAAVSAEFDVEALASGLYTVEVYGADGPELQACFIRK